MFISISISFSNVSMTSSHVPHVSLSLETGVNIRRERLDLRRCDRLAVLQPLQRKQTLMLNCIFMIMDDIVQASEYSSGGMNGVGHIHYNLSLDDHIILAAHTI
ncbi:unnamed protein product [Peronospora farinosa]|uniref:Uncharacterized protein n=1 Tax=Peronospora farinosa TaxID=134698 RepID=A0AAV0UW25_9STRA|nr:unnamed protein product [Peronospora farinosa]CAI5739875.1 unnamed protein product [Peronospora farinosa]